MTLRPDPTQRHGTAGRRGAIATSIATSLVVASLLLALTPLAQAHDPAAMHGTTHPGHATTDAPAEAHAHGHPAATSDADAIRAVLMQTWDQPQARLLVEPIVVQGGVALAGWQQGERGGRALLRKRGQGWIVAICAGDGLKDVALLRDVGVPAAEADSLVRQLAQAESKLDPKALLRLASFDGLVRMDAQGQHPPGHGGAHGAVHGAAHGDNAAEPQGEPHGQHVH